MLTELVSVSGKFLEVLVRDESKSEKCTVKASIWLLVVGGECRWRFEMYDLSGFLRNLNNPENLIPVLTPRWRGGGSKRRIDAYRTLFWLWLTPRLGIFHGPTRVDLYRVLVPPNCCKIQAMISIARILFVSKIIESFTIGAIICRYTGQKLSVNFNGKRIMKFSQIVILLQFRGINQ